MTPIKAGSPPNRTPRKEFTRGYISPSIGQNGPIFNDKPSPSGEKVKNPPLKAEYNSRKDISQGLSNGPGDKGNDYKPAAKIV